MLRLRPITAPTLVLALVLLRPAAAAPGAPASTAPHLPPLPPPASPSRAAPSPAKPAPTAAKRAPKSPEARVPPRYAQSVKQWHTATPGKKAPVDERGRPLLAITALNTGEHVEIPAADEHGGFAGHDIDRVGHLFREPSSGSEHPIEPRLLDVLYRIQRKFGAPEIRLVSGFRPGKSAPIKGPVHPTGSNHSAGRAADIIVPGARDEDVAKFAREIGFVGVGIYPVSGFVHVDVRGQSYFWVDKSGPGRRNRERGVLSDLAKKSDAHASAHGERPTPPFSIGIAVESFLEDRPEPIEGEGDDDDDV